MKKIVDTFNAIEKFHSQNVYLPTRTIYFGKPDNLVSEEDANEINCVTASQTIKNLYILDHLDSKQPITVLLNSPGGTWEDGISIFDVIKSLKSPIGIIGMGQICSMATIVIQSANKRLLLPNTTMMIHDGTDGYIGNPKDFETWAKHSKQTREIMYKIYYDRMKQTNKLITLKQIAEMCNHDTIFTAQEAVEIGLVDGIISPKKDK